VALAKAEYILDEINYHQVKQEYRDKIASLQMDIQKNTRVPRFLALKMLKQGIIFNPDPKTVFHNDDILILLGKEPALREFKKRNTPDI
jgi:Trk K+ transport system NAD-binding subunit